MFFWNRPKVEKLSAQELKQMLDNKEKFILIDVRTPQEFAAGHIPKAKNVPLQMMEGKIKSVAPKMDDPIVLYCHSGSRSNTAARFMLSLGYTNVKSFPGIAYWSYDLKR